MWHCIWSFTVKHSTPTNDPNRMYVDLSPEMLQKSISMQPRKLTILSIKLCSFDRLNIFFCFISITNSAVMKISQSSFVAIPRSSARPSSPWSSMLTQYQHAGRRQSDSKQLRSNCCASTKWSYDDMTCFAKNGEKFFEKLNFYTKMQLCYFLNTS